MDLEFSVNQIRNITCDKGFSKPIGGTLNGDVLVVYLWKLTRRTRPPRCSNKDKM